MGKPSKRKRDDAAAAATPTDAPNAQQAKKKKKKKKKKKQKVSEAPAPAAAAPEDAALLASLKAGDGGSLSDRLNPDQPHFDAALKARWKSMGKKARAALWAACEEAAAARGGGTPGGVTAAALGHDAPPLWRRLPHLIRRLWKILAGSFSFLQILPLTTALPIC